MAAERVFALAAHPDDIEFMMSGTLFLLKEQGLEIHYMNLADGSCGSAEMDPDQTVRVREQEARNAAAYLGAVYHPPLAVDLEITYNIPLLKKTAAVFRDIKPDILLLQSPQDYMEDHINTVRIGVTAAFSRGMPNFSTDPEHTPVPGDAAVYHAQPYGLRGPLGEMIVPHFFVDVEKVMERRIEMLAMHRSQKEWLDRSQGMDSYLQISRDFCRETGEQSGRFTYAEGWRRRNPLGFSGSGTDPLREVLGDYVFTPE
ncbi:MAG: PIG-L deacetylase family protein [Spirochaetia bacterium]